MTILTNIRRERYGEACAAPDERAYARRLLKLLLMQDGSTTRLCETIAGGAIDVLVHHQRSATKVPDAVAQAMPGTTFIERCTSLIANGQVMMDNLVYVAVDTLDNETRADIIAGVRPLGHLLDRLWVRRAAFNAAPAALYETLWETVGMPDLPAARAYRIEAATGTIMVIAETFRHGMLMDSAMPDGKSVPVARIA